MRIQQLSVLVFVACMGVAISACDADLEPLSEVSDAVSTAVFSGTVVGVQGTPVAGARVTINGVARTTGSDGKYAVSVVQSVSGYRLDIRKDGFGPVTEFRLGGALSLVHQLPSGTTLVINPAVNNSVFDQNSGIRVGVPAGSLRSNAGAPSGNVRFTIIPHTSQTMPGDFTGRNANEAQVALISVGAVTLQAVDSAGATLGLVQGAALQVTLPVPASAGGVMPSCVQAKTCRIAVWRFEPATALWAEIRATQLSTGVTATVFKIAGTGASVTISDGLGSWNIDMELTGPACTVVELVGLAPECYNPGGAVSEPGIKITAAQTPPGRGKKTKDATVLSTAAFTVIFNEVPDADLDLSLVFPPGAPASCAARLIIDSTPAQAAGFPMLSATGAAMRLATGAAWGGTGYPNNPGPPPTPVNLDDVVNHRYPCHSSVQIASGG